jgi:glucose 1-dehydrogenase
VRAITVEPGVADSARLENVPEPDPSQGSVVVRTIAMGVCGTDINIIQAEYGSAPDGDSRLILGHESLGEVMEAPKDSGLKPGQHVAGIVRWPDPVPCESCAHGEWDMCRNGRYTEHGIKGVHGFGAEYFRLDPDRLVPVDRSLGIAGVLMEPASILAKAWEHIDRFAARTRWCPNRVLVTGAGPIGLLAALLGVQRGHEVHVLDKVKDGPKPGLVEALGAHYHCSDVEQAGRDADIVLECTGVGKLIGDVMHVVAPSGIVCLTGVSSGGRELPFDIEGLNRTLVLENNVVFGTVNANRRHYEQAAEALAQADHDWLHKLITRTVSLDDWATALEREEHDVKPVIRFGDS